MLLIPPPPAVPVRFSDQPNIFSRARAAGLNTAAVGYYLPYGRVLNKDLTFCWWAAEALAHNAMGESFGPIFRNQVRSLLEVGSNSPFGQTIGVRWHARMHRLARAHATRLVANPDFGFILLHLPIPHGPHAYDRTTGQFTLTSPISGYYDSLALLDLTVAVLRKSMEAVGLWEETTVLLSSDHWNRYSELLDGKKDHRIPFLLKLAGQQRPLEYNRPFNTILTHDLLMAILHREVTDVDEAAQWLDRHRTIADSPYSIDDSGV
jgi:hypothetical protein